MRNNYGRAGHCEMNNHRPEEDCYQVENHNHEFESSTDYKKNDEGVIHNHRIAGVTGPAIKCGKSHVHKVTEYTDTFGDHFHEVCVVTGPAIYLPGGKHIHIIMGKTTPAEDNNHRHDFYFATLIEDPTEVPKNIGC